jgi:hypothetical protein
MSHNLNINSYSFAELLGLFDITTFEISLEQLKHAKKKVLMTHPDKSKLPAEYFIFYKNAFEIVLNFYKNNNKINEPITENKLKYNIEPSHNKTTNSKINSIIQDMGQKEFHAKFNDLFEKNMISKQTTDKNDWFHKDDPTFEIKEHVSNANMGIVLENIKQKTKGIVKYKGVENLFLNCGGVGTSYYDEDDKDEDDNIYVNCDPFSKLKFEDLRKVHKDQTVFAVSDSDYNKISSKYSSLENYSKERGGTEIKPISKEISENIMMEQERVLKEKMARKYHQSELKTQSFIEKNKNILANFLRLQN